MTHSRLSFERLAFYLTCASAISILFSIAICQILLALAFATVLMSKTKLQLPPIWLSIALFFAGTVLSLMLSPDPSAARPQIRKFFVFLFVLVVYTTFRKLEDVRYLVLIMSGVAAISGLLGLTQFFRKYQEAQELHRSFYQVYVADRITGFTSHWMTFGGEEVLVLLMTMAFLLFAPAVTRPLYRSRIWFWMAALILLISVILGWTRSLWLGLAAGVIYLLWSWRRWSILVLPIALAAGFLLGPHAMRERLTSFFEPHGDMDSNRHRIVCWRTGLEMIKAHPWFGVGPGVVNVQFKNYVPADMLPLPEGYYGHLHNIYIHYGAERGIPTMLALLYMLLKILFDFSRALRRLPQGPSDSRFILHGGIALVIAAMVTGFFELNLGDSEVLTMFLVMVSCGYVAIREMKLA